MTDQAKDQPGTQLVIPLIGFSRHGDAVAGKPSLRDGRQPRMNSTSRPLATAADLVLQRMLVDRPIDNRSLYWRASASNAQYSAGIEKRVDQVGETLHVQPNTIVSFNTYFNAFFESIWRRHTCLGTLVLRVTVDGPCTLRLLRRAVGRQHTVHEGTVHSGTVTIPLRDHAVNFRQHGLLWLELETGDQAATFRGGAWLADGCGYAGAKVSLSVVICTFNREADVGRLLTSIAADPGLQHALTRIFVVNQGRPGLAGNAVVAAAAQALGERLRLVEQGNFGGAGGFGRGMLEALDDPEVTHAVLLDDDIALEADSLPRMAAFFALSKAPAILGGHMLDAVQPTMLFEAGAILSDRHWTFQAQHHSRDLTDPHVFEALTAPAAVHYNGWWCCGIPLSVVRQYGLPLPCFIRGDDVEYGLRLHQAGVPTIPLPGVAVWHDPFYLKNGGWHLYYETRNVLIAASLHQPINRWEVVRRMGRHLAMNLLTFRYYNAALIIQGIRDFLAGPSLLQGSPQAVHLRVTAIRRQHPAVFTRRDIVLEPQRLGAAPRMMAGFIVMLVRLTLHNLISPTVAAPRRLLNLRDLAWPMMSGVEHIAVETWWDEKLPTFHRSREEFRRLAFESAAVLFALFRQAHSQTEQWKASAAELTSEAFWRGYLGVDPADKSAVLRSLVAPSGRTSEVATS